jgi:hypothetical protein
MAVENASFETPGVDPGQADQWSEGYDVGASDIADFVHYDGYTRPFDDFEQSWLDNQLAQSGFSLTDVVAALFDGLSMQHENFESGWWEPHSPASGPNNYAAMLYFYSGNFAFAMFNSGGDEVEAFEEQWGSSPYNEAAISTYAEGSWSTALFDAGAPEAFEDFEEEWKYNEAWFLLASAYLAANFDTSLGAPEAYEDFEEGWTETLP